MNIEFPKYTDLESPINKFLTTSSMPHTYPAKIARKNPPRGNKTLEARKSAASKKVRPVPYNVTSDHRLKDNAHGIAARYTKIPIVKVAFFLEYFNSSTR